MVRSRSLVPVATALVILTGWSILGAGQIPLSPVRDAGQTVTPAYEGWYPNPDGTFTLSFGYYNRNREEIVDIPLGPDNFISPGPPNQGQPTRLHPRRHWGVFTVAVPADFGDKRLTWTLVNKGQAFAIPGHLRRDWLLDAKLDAASGNTPPAIKFDPSGPEGTGPDGVTTGPVAASVGWPLEVTLWATDDEVRRVGRIRQEDPILLRWFVHRGAGVVDFSEREPKVDSTGKSTTMVTFREPGDYVLRVRVNDYSGNVRGGHSQCCWTNGYVKVAVAD